MIIEFLTGEIQFNYTGGKHHMPQHPMQGNKVKKTSLKKPQLKSWWYWQESYPRKGWTPAAIINDPRVANGVPIKFYDAHNDQYVKTTVFDRRLLKFSENA